MKRYRILIVLLTAFAATLACAVSPPTSDVNAIVTQTIGALTGSPSTPIPSLAPMDEGILPDALYFLAPDAAGFAQIYRLAKDGKTRSQVTFEPADVDSYDVNQIDGRVVYVSNNQILLINNNGLGRQVLFDPGVPDEVNPFLNDIQTVAWSPNGETIAYGYQGLNLYSIASGASNRVIENKIQDVSGGLIIPTEMYWPDSFSPDGTKLLITLGYYEGAGAAIYYPAGDALVRLSNDQGAMICCGEPNWTADSSALFQGYAQLGMYSPGLWRVDATNGKVTTLISGDPGDQTFNFADEPFLSPDGQLYFFFASLPYSDEFVSRTPLKIVRSSPDGVTGRTVLLPDTFEMMTEALWTPDASYVVVAIAQNDQTYQGGQLEYISVSGTARIVLAPFGRALKWGP